MRVRHLLAAASLALAIALLGALIVTALAARANEYLTLGFHRTVVFLLADRLRGFLVPALAVGGVWALALTTGSETRARRLVDRLPALLAAAGAAGLVLRFAIRYNLNEFSKQWSRTGELLGFEVPQAFVKWYVLATNLAFLVAMALLAFAVHRLIGHLLQRAGFSPRRAWSRIGRLRVALPLLALALVPYLAARTLRGGAEAAPNFIVISLDTLRADHLGCYGYGRDTSPNLDRLAAEGYRFEWAISQAPRTDLSHMSLFTSLYPSVHRVASPHALPPPRLTLAELLRERGYRTAGFTDGGYLRRGLGFAQGFERYDDTRPVGFVETSANFLEWQAGLPPTTPFFAFLHTYQVHFPYEAPEPWQDRFVDPAYNGRFAPDTLAWKELGRAADPVSATTVADVEYVKARYDGGLRWVDSLVGDLRAELERRGLLETTWLIVTSDHGEEFLEHGQIFHQVVYHTVARVPLIFRPPGGADVPRATPEIVELIDVAPTLLGLAGVDPPNDIDGTSLLPLLRGAGNRGTGVAFSEAPFRDYWHRGVTTAGLHLIVSSAAEELEIFDYHADPLEQSPLAPGERPEEVEAATRLLARWSHRVGGPGTGDRRSEETLDPETERQLRALGYLD